MTKNNSVPRDYLFDKCLDKAEQLIKIGYTIGDVTTTELAETLWKLENEKQEKDALSDQSLDYNDEIVSIEDVGQLETIDISVSGDNLFYCNGILTKNSFGLPATADAMFALISSEELEDLGQLMVKQLKNRWGDINNPRRFVIGIDRSRMKLYDAEESAQQDLVKDDSNKKKQPERTLMDNTDFGQRMESDDNITKFRGKKPKFEGFA